MKKIITLAVICFATTIFSVEKNSFIGTWCVGDDGLVLTFSGKDTLMVASLSDSSMKGRGTYQKDDTTFLTTINTQDGISMQMKYRYRWKDKNIVEAQAIYMTANGESVDAPKEWNTMTRCVSGKSVQQTGSTEPAKAVPSKKNGK